MVVEPKLWFRTMECFSDLAVIPSSGVACQPGIKLGRVRNKILNRNGRKTGTGDRSILLIACYSPETAIFSRSLTTA
jgi:hypothetical protein